MPIPWTLPPEPSSWWEEPAPCPAGAVLQSTERGTWCWREGTVGQISRRDGLGRVIEEGSYDEVAEKHGRWVRWTRGPGESVVSWTVSLYDHGKLLPWAHASKLELVDEPFPVLAITADPTEEQWRAGLRRHDIPVPTAWGGSPLLEEVRTHSLGTTWVIQDGQVVGAVEGWQGPQDVRLEVLLEALQKGVEPGSLVKGP
jgi:hypothetical protein